jgi:hypothetical protein
VFVCRDAHTLLACAREVDEAMSGRIGVMGRPVDRWYFAGRDHVFFAEEAAVHAGRVEALALPNLPPGPRRRLTGDPQLELTRVTLLPEAVIAAGRGL